MHTLTEELVAEGITVERGPAPMEERGGGREALEALRITIQILGEGLIVAGTGTCVARLVRVISAALRGDGRDPRPS